MKILWVERWLCGYPKPGSYYPWVFWETVLGFVGRVSCDYHSCQAMFAELEEEAGSREHPIL